MIDPGVVFWPSVATMVLAIVLLAASAAAFGRILADLEYQIEAGINGVRRIQSKINLRTHGNRMMLAVFGLFVGGMGLTDLPIVWQNWISGALFLVVLAIYGASSLMDWVAERRQVLILIRERDAGLKPGVVAVVGSEPASTQHAAAHPPEDAL